MVEFVEPFDSDELVVPVAAAPPSNIAMVKARLSIFSPSVWFVSFRLAGLLRLTVVVFEFSFLF